ncbi:uncharacterized protein LOC123221432 [Mangifera indica]|uniref:uncharacterized protein LOC123221432 n=1 Tax=Mangifera indica TaxID=29780 RepID=UPI001CFBE989|nr:uncharacterized protein LOC123221432 [Mangifera indica]
MMMHTGYTCYGRVKAVKQLSLGSHQGKNKFVNEIATIIAETLLWQSECSTLLHFKDWKWMTSSVGNSEISAYLTPDIMLYLCEKEHVEGGMIFQLLKDLTEMSTMTNCKDVFGYIECKQHILEKQELFAHAKLMMLRMCNQLLGWVYYWKGFRFSACQDLDGIKGVGPLELRPPHV